MALLLYASCAFLIIIACSVVYPCFNELCTISSDPIDDAEKEDNGG